MFERSKQLEIYTQPNFACRSIDLYFKHAGAWGVSVAFSQIDAGDQPPVTCSLDDQEAQALMDRLWACGLRPTEGKGSAGALAATERHLQDMQRLVFEKETHK